jgi:nitroimidazol reductase NimA-like FMN-containing flavoprotein (pyridoxamine 5'-phosphate oxidase superfamily)
VEDRDPGDFGRRVAERRQELDLSRADVARQAGMDPGYLEYLEERPSASPDISTRRRLAATLSMSLDRLEGGGFGEPVGASRHRPGGVAVVEELDRAGCYALLRHGGIGRVLFVAARGPVGLPVNFRLLGNDIVFRTGDGSIRGAVQAGGAISLEVDRLDDALGEGWSVLVTGHAVVVEDVEELRRIDALEVQSWAGEDRPNAVRLGADEITGRRIRRHLRVGEDGS